MSLPTNLDSLPVRSLEFALPSAGVPYANKDKTVIIKPFSFITESILIGNLTPYEKMKRIVQKVAEFPSGKMNTDDLLISDEYLILAIARALTYGEVYKFRVVCPECAYIGEEAVKIPDQLITKHWEPDMTYPLEVNLPVCKDRVALRFLTIGDDGVLDRYAREILIKQNKTLTTAEGDATHIRRMAMHIVSVNGEKPAKIEDADEYISRLFGEDMAAFKQLLIDNVSGISYDWTVQCDKCKFIHEVHFPIAADFFRRT